MNKYPETIYASLDKPGLVAVTEYWKNEQEYIRKDLYDKLQARLDALMLEYCPEEMTKEQVDNWAKSQRVAEVFDAFNDPSLPEISGLCYENKRKTICQS